MLSLHSINGISLSSSWSLWRPPAAASIAINYYRIPRLHFSLPATTPFSQQQLLRDGKCFHPFDELYKHTVHSVSRRLTGSLPCPYPTARRLVYGLHGPIQPRSENPKISPVSLHAKRRESAPVEDSHRMNPTVPIEGLPLSSALKKRLLHLGVTHFNALQQRSLYPLLRGDDVIVRSPTGSGKTLAYLIPLLQRLKNEKWETHFPALIIVPTRELVEQVSYQLHRLKPSKDIHIAVLYGNQNVENQTEILRWGAHIVIGTPHRIAAVLKTPGRVDFESLKVLIVDEVDEVLSRGFDEDMKTLLQSCNPLRQTAIFSATFPPWLHEKSLEPIFVHSDRTQKSPPFVLDLLQAGMLPLSPLVKHHICKVSRHPSKRIRLLAYIIETLKEKFEEGKVIIFCSTRNEASLVSNHPWLYARSKPLHSDLPQHQRQATLQEFRAHKFHVLVASDLAARGLDVEGVGLIFHYSPPLTIESYIHRSGRTGRRGEAGKSIILYDSSEKKHIRQLERELCQTFVEWEAPTETAVRDKFLDIIGDELLQPVGVDSTAYEEHAKHQLDLHGPRLLAAALVLLERRKQFKTWKSAMSGRFSYTPLLFCDPFCQKLRSRSQLLDLVKKCLPEKFHASIGRIALSRRGYVVDLPSDAAHHVLRSETLKAASIHAMYVANLPPIVEDEVRYRVNRLKSPQLILNTLSNRLRQTPLSVSARRRLVRRLARRKEQVEIQSFRKKLKTTQHKKT
ncbi:DEAD/DEAH box helicase domain-containing protein [Cardiosporidium cionae]|uniref:DEAD/DEAH box helicase domain-containing protein n=1 Tax=Cardiosporidium cionae TaxID=476202 RepID=A0ABQ7J591_9APIC|nr:DEAD/DEAH box helicase domain-containing protein [Cardiosporidium cionae]|eukprot:KAF8819123.1 DEAD/DEAH box helicase domain-containing protein [Cardiosporidium cionae]